ncbi:MAG: type I methionyl aminopeptidase [Mycoplasma sp.]|nr:type I methionyl aminopeptidase [Mycoplasma sp.]
MINIYNEEQIIKIKKSCKIISKVKKELKKIIKPGLTPIELDKYAEKRILELEAKPAFKGYQGFKNTLCISLNDDLIHGIPNDKPFKNGDIIKIDMGCIYKGYYSDTAFTIGLGNLSNKDKHLIKTAKEAFEAGLNAIKPGSRVGDISKAIGLVIKNNGFFTPKEFSGHGIGSSLHEEPYIFNEPEVSKGPLLKDGMVIAIEPMLLQKSQKIKILNDGWTVKSLSGKNSSHYEETVLIKNGYGIILTKGDL